MGHADFRAHGRIFATLRGDGSHAMVKLTPAQQKRYLGSGTGFTPESGAWGEQGCTRILLAAVDAETAGEALTLAWQNLAAATRNPKPQNPKPKSQRSKRR